MLEKIFTTKWSHWFKNNRVIFKDNCTFEMKVTKTNTFSLKAWREGKQSHQITNLHDSASPKGILWKIPDCGYLNKYDVTFQANASAYLVLYYNKHKEFFMIPIQKVPPTDSISYEYCVLHFTTNKLLNKKVCAIVPIL